MFESISNFSLYLRLGSVKWQLNVLQEAFTALRFRALSFWMELHFTQPWLHTLISGILAETTQIWSCWLAHENSIVAENNAVTAWAWSVNEHQIRLLFESSLHPGQIRGSRASGDKAESKGRQKFCRWTEALKPMKKTGHLSHQLPLPSPTESRHSLGPSFYMCIFPLLWFSFQSLGFFLEFIYLRIYGLHSSVVN